MPAIISISIGIRVSIRISMKSAGKGSASSEGDNVKSLASKASRNPFDALTDEPQGATSKDFLPERSKAPIQTSSGFPSPASAVDSDKIASQNYAAEKLKRQAERINQSEAVLEDIVKSKTSTTRSGRANKWKPFDLRSEFQETQPVLLDSPSIRGTPFNVEAEVFQPKPLAPDATSSVLSQIKDTGSVAASSSLGDINWFNPKALKLPYPPAENKRDDHFTTLTVSSHDKHEINEVFGNDLPSPSYVSANPGTSNGQVQFCMHPNGDVSAHQWSEVHYQWINIGQFSNTRKKAEGQLASVRLKEETEYLALLQNTLPYFHAVAKQREAFIMQKPFGMKDIQACMPNINVKRTTSNDPKQHLGTGVANSFDIATRTSSKPLVAVPKTRTPHGSQPPLDDILRSMQQSPLDRRLQRDRYQTSGSGYGPQPDLKFGSMHAVSARNTTPTPGPGRYVGPPNFGGAATRAGTRSVMSSASFASVPEGVTNLNRSGSGIASRKSTNSSYVPSTLSSSEIHAQAGGQLTTLKDILHRLPVEKGGHGENPINPAVTPRDMRYMTATHYGSSPHVSSDQQTYDSTHILAHHDAEAQQHQRNTPPSSSLYYTKTPGRAPVQQDTMTRNTLSASTGSIGGSEHDVAALKRDPFTTQLPIDEIARMQEPPTPQNLEVMSVNPPMTPPRHLVPDYDMLSDYDRALKSWFFSGHAIAAHHELTTREILASSSMNTPSRPGGPAKKTDPGVIGTRPKAKATATASNMIRTDSMDPRVVVVVEQDKTEQILAENTRLLVALNDSLQAYKQAGTRGHAAKRGHWNPFVPAPEWAVDKGIGGNTSFLEGGGTGDGEGEEGWEGRWVQGW